MAVESHYLSTFLLEARRAEKDFLLRLDEKYAVRHAEVMNSATSSLARFEQGLAALRLNELASRLAAAKALVEQYTHHFNTLTQQQKTLGLNQNSGLQGTLRASVHAIETKAKELKDFKLEAAMLTMRRHEKDYMLRRDMRYQDEMKKAAADFTAIVNAADIQQPIKDDLLQRLAAYQRDFFAYMGLTQTNLQTQRALSDTYAKLEPELEAVSQQVERSRFESESAAAAATARTTLEIQIIMAAMTILLGLIGYFVGRSISRPMKAITTAMRELAAGRLETAIPGVGRKDEIGEMASALDVFKTNALDRARLEAEQKAAEQRAAAERKAELQRLADAFQSAVGTIVETVSTASSELETAASVLTSTAAQTQQLSTIVASASEEASSNVQSVASASEELGSSVNEISRQVQESSRIAAEAVTQADKTDSRITELSQAASRIGDVVKLITAIAEQTNLLALNATIEAARAGEAGRGFAVVAQEVKALASQTAKATDEISSQIAGMQASTEGSVAAIKEIGQTIGRISQIAGAIATAVEEQGAATQEIARNVQQAAQGTAQVAANIGDVNKGAAATGSASEKVLASAQALSSQDGMLKAEVESFLKTVRAA